MRTPPGRPASRARDPGARSRAPAARAGSAARGGRGSGEARGDGPRLPASDPLVVRVRRVYDPPEPQDGFRVLVDRLWPRGLFRARVDLWLREVAPSDALRRWFGHDPARWPEFRRRYRAELAASEHLPELRALARRGRVTLLFAARDLARNNAVVLAEFLEDLVRGLRPRAPRPDGLPPRRAGSSPQTGAVPPRRSAGPRDLAPAPTGAGPDPLPIAGVSLASAGDALTSGAGPGLAPAAPACSLPAGAGAREGSAPGAGEPGEGWAALARPLLFSPGTMLTPALLARSRGRRARPEIRHGRSPVGAGRSPRPGRRP